MSAVVCGKRSSLFEDLPSSPPVSKRIRCSSSSSPVRFSPPRHTAGSPSFSPPAIDHLSTLFPNMDEQLLQKALEECGNDLDLAIRSLNELQLGSTKNLVSAASKTDVRLGEIGQFLAPVCVRVGANILIACV